MNKKIFFQKEKVLRRAWIVSAVGFIGVIFAFLVSDSVTIFADLTRRGIELTSLFVSWIIFIKLQKQRLEKIVNIFIATAMLITSFVILSGAVEQLISPAEPGWLIPGILVAIVGMINNSYFWRKYTKILGNEYSNIIKMQQRLYRSKSVVDITVLVTLTLTHFLHQFDWGIFIDPAGSMLIALFVFGSAIKIIWELFQ